MANPNGRKGSGFETDLVKHLRSLGLNAERLPKAGVSDQGDVVLKLGVQSYVFECKNKKTMDLAAAVKEAEAEAGSYAQARGVPPVNWAALVKRRNHGIADAYVVVPLRQWLDQVCPPF